jgi:flagellar hook-associated protein FlgK
LSDLLAIGASAVNAYQRALATVGNNIANLSTEGYSRQEAALSAGAPAQAGQLYLGTGVNVTGIKRAYDAFAQANLRDTGSALAAQQPLLDFVNRVVDVLGNQQSGLGGALSAFFSSAQAIATSPASTDARSSFLASADSLAARFRGMAGQFDMLDEQSAAAVDKTWALSTVSPLNSPP